MALIECYECGKQISDAAPTCPSCGAPNKENNDSSQTVAIQWKAVQWKALLSQVAIIWIVTFVLSFLFAWVSKSLIVAGITNIICLITAFTLIYYITKENRIQHCINVAFVVWLLSIINTVLFGVPFINWLLSVFLVFVCMSIGMLISYLIGLSKND
jgi:hypothetical protein